MASELPQPSFKLHTPAVDFIENRLPQYHPAFDTRYVEFQASDAMFVPSSNSAIVRRDPSAMPIILGASPPSQQLSRPTPGLLYEMAFWQDILPQAMTLLRAEPSLKTTDGPRWGIRHLSKWADIQAKLEMARHEYDFHHGSQHVGRFRRFVREGLDKYGPTLQQGAKLVPEVDISKPIVGAIRVVLDAYRQSSEVRKTVGTNFEDLPEAFEAIDFYLRTYPKDENIAAASRNLVVAILVAIERAIVFYTSHQAKRAGMALLSGPQYQRTLLHTLEEVKTGCAALERQASMSFTHRVTSDNQQIMQQNQLTQHILLSFCQQNTLGSLGKQFVADLANTVLSLFNDHQRDIAFDAPITRSPSPLPQLMQSPPMWQPRDLLFRLGIPNIDEDDLSSVAAHTEVILHEDRGRTQQLLGDRLFRDWMGGSNSSRLLVHGNFRPPFEISPLSTIATLLTHVFRAPGNNSIGLVFFCGQHLARDECQGGQAMIRSIIAQLISQFTFGPTHSEPPIPLQDIETAGISLLCEMFVALVRQLPPNMRVFCIIDGISFYETEDYLHEMAIVVMSLVQFVDDTRHAGRTCFKLLITSPQSTWEVRKVFDSEPDSLLHMHNFPMVGGEMSLASFRRHAETQI